MNSDNINRAPVQKENDTVRILVANAAYQENTPRFLANVIAEAEYNDYQDDTFGDEGIYDLRSTLLWVLSPQRFTWSVEEVFEQRVIASSLADTPDNRTDVNVFSTGPDFYIRLNPLHTLALGARAGNVYTGTSNFDNDRYSGSLRWLYQTTSISTFSFNFVTQDVNYDDPVANVDFTRHDTFFRYEYRPSRSQYVVDLGASKVNKDRGEDLDGSLAKFTLHQQLSMVSSFGFSLSGELADTGTDIITAPLPITTIGVTPVSVPSLSADVVNELYYAKRAFIYYTRRGKNLGLAITLGAQDLDYETPTLDQREKTGDLMLDYFYSGTTTISLFSEQSRIDFHEIFRRDTDRDSGVRWQHRLSRSISIGLEGRRIDRNSTDPLREYVDNRALFSILYTSGSIPSPVFGR
ncbi:MAG: hypothetical protein OEY27_05415 [Gammaproteobacteria bacterium]|nr:hypothetical protein [Gammaproteobacteria bacterium]